MLYSPTVPCVDGSYYNSSSVYARKLTDSNMDERYVTGGNALFKYIDVLHDLNMDPFLNISHCLFSLGADSSFGYDVTLNIYTIFNSLGTGLSVYIFQIPYYVTISIESTVTYRNQAATGDFRCRRVSPHVDGRASRDGQAPRPESRTRNGRLREWRGCGSRPRRSRGCACVG